ncbi:hypothetical protein ACJROX_26780 [Pseudalkalibacillus sp. A8]|uniref:hypothetical protein n=1 Tax=Pseudalkalibacillus sp. A8 TaxID=3382641 RepID=UPI0038B6AB54
MYHVPDGIYVTGVKGHSGLQGLTIYSRDMTANTHIIKVRVKENILEIYVDQNNNSSHNEQHLVYQVQTYRTPLKYVIYKNGKSVKSKEIPYSIE